MTPNIDTAPLGTPTGTSSDASHRDECRIYVACLAAYNNGILHGRWIDAAQGEDHIWNETRAVLKSSPIAEAEEWAIHDYEGFEGASLHEYSSFESVADLAEFVSEHGELGAKLYEHFGERLDEARAAFEDYAGEHKSLADFAEDLTRDCGPEIPEQLQFYIDWTALARDMELNGDVFTIETGFDQIHVFWSR
ncbi:MAG: antirestriction protein ArdA [Pseudomonadota bacterium]